MMAKLCDLHDRAEVLCNEVMGAIPRQYREHDLVKGMYRDDDRRKRLFELGRRDPVTGAWIELYWRALLLPFDIHDVISQLDDRATRNAKERGALGEPANTAKR